MFRLRRLWLVVHRWLGLTIGWLFVLLGLTGSLLVFDHAIDEWLNPGLLLTEGSGSRRPLAEVIAAAEHAHAKPAQRALSVTRPRVANGVWTVWFSSESVGEPQFTAVYVDPYTARVNGQRIWGADLMSWIYRLHFRLLAGEVGATIVGLSGIAMLISLGSGIWLWWPLWTRGWRPAFAIRKGRLFNYDLHKLLGIASGVILLVITFTGAYMEFPNLFQGCVGTFAAVSKPNSELKSVRADARQTIAPDEAIAIAQARFPHAVFDHLHPPGSVNGVYEVAFRQADEVQRSFGRSQVFLDQYSGEVLAVCRPQDGTAADAFFAWQFPLHNGEAFGLLGRWVVFVSGLVPAVLYTTGVLMWWRKRQSRRLQSRRDGETVSGVKDRRFVRKPARRFVATR